MICNSSRPLLGHREFAPKKRSLAFNRRAFLKAASLPCLAACAGAVIGRQDAVPIFAAPLAEDESQFIKEARFYDKQAYRKIKCKLCPRECVIDDRERGYCGVRENRGGTYYTLVHSRVVTATLIPSRRSPSSIFSLAPSPSPLPPRAAM